MSTIPDIRALPFDEDVFEKKYIDQSAIGYVCATIICCVMLYFDGAVAVACAAGVAGSIAGISATRRLKA